MIYFFFYYDVTEGYSDLRLWNVETTKTFEAGLNAFCIMIQQQAYGGPGSRMWWFE